MCETFFKDSKLTEQEQKYLHLPEVILGGFPVYSINSVHINIYIYIHTSALTLLGRFSTRLAQTTTALWLLYALNRHFVPRECEFFQKNSNFLPL